MQQTIKSTENLRRCEKLEIEMKTFVKSLQKRLRNHQPSPPKSENTPEDRSNQPPPPPEDDPSSPFRFQILSDPHLEVGQQYSSYDFPACAPYLILAGDIGRLIDYPNYLTFLEAQASRFKLVFLVLGNHEFYGTSYETGLSEARRLCQEPSLTNKCILLHQTRYDIPTDPANPDDTGPDDTGATVLGCTLWSHIPEANAAEVAARVQDFSRISSWTIATHNSAHEQEVSWLRRQLAELQTPDAKERKVLVITHHAPTKEATSAPQYTGNPWSCAFSTEVLRDDPFGYTEGVNTWVFGHTHYSTDFSLPLYNASGSSARVVANQRGYVLPGSSAARKEEELQQAGYKKEKTGIHEFDPTKVVSL
ncbi:Metallophosphoesterase domain protein [Diplogelasinospora grovesii]|uniref:Metallophosphoesterase domain protein n=1 Tax=Diplogelasinospora grovesii TaxID=303347 RepID=A0AAN6SAM6_9PEZI|nr:Metallophosphoesterase domain protein [Diplogelasinospora grovesii]